MLLQAIIATLGRSAPPAPLSLTNANLVADGNSYTAGYPSVTPYSTLIMQKAPFTTNGAVMHNFGVSGQTTPQMLSDESSQVLSTHVNGVVNIILFQEGGNDIYYNGDVTAAINNVKTYCNNARAAGFKIIVSTLIHRNQTSSFGDSVAVYNGKLDSFNTALLADNSYYDGVIRPDLEPIWATYTSGGYYSDQIHPNETPGYQKYADLYYAQILAITGN